MQMRQDRIIELLADKKNWVTGKELSTILNVSDRTIRSDIDQLGTIYKGLIESSARYGYRINQNVLEKSKIELKGRIPNSPEERCKYIVKKLLFDRPRLNVFDLQYDIYVSESTLKSDFKKLSEMLDEYEGVRLVKEGNYISLEGSERSKRLLYKNMLSNETKGNFININKIDQLFPNFDLIRIKNILEDVLAKHNYKIREENFPMLIIHIGVSIQRMMDCHYIETGRDSVGITQTPEYVISTEFFERITSILHFEINQNEVVLFAHLLIGRQNNAEQNNEGYLLQAEELTIKIINMIQERYDIDFSGDNLFKDGLVLHLQNLLERMTHQIDVSNICLAELKKAYPLIFEMSVFMGHIIEKYTMLPVSEDEIGFLAIHIGAAYDRLNIGYFYHAVLIQPNSIALSTACSEKIMKCFGDKLVIDAILPYYEASDIEKLRPDLIITTASLSHKLDIPTIQISMFVKPTDEYKIFREIAELDKKNQRNAFENFIKELILEDYYFYNLECNSYEAVINYMADKLYEGGRVEENFKKSTFEREKMAYTSFSYGYAIPHALNYSALKSTMSIAVLKKSVQWGDYQVKYVFMLAIREDEKELLKIFFDWFGNICDNALHLSNIMKARTASEFIKTVIE